MKFSKNAIVLAAMLVGLAFLPQSRSLAACTITITSAYTCDANGNAYSPEVGDVYYVRVNWNVTGTPAAPYPEKFQEANFSGTTSQNTPALAGSFYTYYGFQMPLDSSIPVTITVDPNDVSGAPSTGRTFTFSFTPVPPPTAVAYFNTLTYTGQETFSLDWADYSGTITSGLTLMGIPTSGTFEQALNYAPPDGSSVVATLPSGDPALETDYSNYQPVPGNDTWSTTNTFNVAVSSVRANPAMLAAVPWSAFTSLPSSFQQYLVADTLVQSTDPTITQFVATVLPANYKTTLTPYAAAKALFLAVVARTTYAENPDTVSAGDALSTYNRSAGDCLGFSTLFSACMRSIGIPCRCLCGFWSGTDDWHCIMEFYLPGAGWLPADGSIDKLDYDPSGTYSYLFGSDPLINTFCEVSRGTDHHTANISCGELQVGQQLINGYATLTGGGTVNSLTAVSLPPAFSLYVSPPDTSVTQGTSNPVVVTINPSNGFTGSVTFGVSGLPSGVTAQYQSATSTTSSNLTFTATASAPVGTYPISVTGTSGSLSTSTAMQLTVAASAPSVPHAFAAGLCMISTPTGYASDSLASVLGYASPLLAVWQPGPNTYATTPNGPANSLVLGQGYWVRFPASETIESLGTPQQSGTPATIALSTGWNMIGCPQITSVAVNSVSVINSSSVTNTFADAVSNGLVQANLFTWQSSDTAYEVIPYSSGNLTPYEGYWLYAYQPCTLSFPALGG